MVEGSQFFLRTTGGSHVAKIKMKKSNASRRAMTQARYAAALLQRTATYAATNNSSASPALHSAANAASADGDLANIMNNIQAILNLPIDA
jgi:hypothetical protein